MQVRKIADELESVREAVAQTVTGYDDAVTDLLVGLIADGHVLLVGVPGLAKTTLAKAFARAVGMEFGRVQFTQDMLPADVTGHYYYDQGDAEFRVRKGPVFTNVLLADEVNRAPPKTQSAMLEAMQEGQATIEGETFPLPEPFFVIATLNPVDVEGVYHLPEAQLDRFLLRSRMEYLDAETERAMLARQANHPSLPDPVLDAATVKAAQEAAENIVVAEPVIAYVQALGEATREHEAIELGTSPRAMEHLMHASRAHALLEGRDYVIPEDVQAVAVGVLAHRLILDVDAEMEGKTDVGIVKDVLDTTPVPKGFRGADIEDEKTPETLDDEASEVDEEDASDEEEADVEPEPVEAQDEEDQEPNREEKEKDSSVRFTVKDRFEDW